MLTPPPSISPDIAALSAAYHISAAGYVDLAAVNRRAVSSFALDAVLSNAFQ